MADNTIATSLKSLQMFDMTRGMPTLVALCNNNAKGAGPVVEK